jgi:hypothetical protein
MTYSFNYYDMYFQLCRCFFTVNIYGRQDHTFQFRGGLVNYEAHCDLS